MTGNLVIKLTSDGTQRSRALAVPGAYWSRAEKSYMVDNPNSRAAAATIALFPHTLVDHPELITIRNAAYGDARPHSYADELNMELDLGGGFPLKLYGYQNTDAGYLKAILQRDKGVHVGWDRGLGKTVVAAAFIQSLGAQRSLVVARNEAKDAVWLKQLSVLLPDHNIVVLPDSSQATKRDKVLKMIEQDASVNAVTPAAARPLVLIIHYQAIRTVAGAKVVEHRDGTQDEFKGGGNGWKRLGNWDLMLYDEAHRLASYNPNSKRNTVEGRALSTLRRQHVDMAVNLTGSGIMNHEDDLFGQLHFILPNVYRAKWRDWNDRFVDYVEVNGRNVPIGFKAEALPALRKELGVFMVYRKKGEVFADLPPIIHDDVKLDLLPAQRKAYEQMRDEWWAEIEAGGLKAVNVMDQLNKLRQIATWIEGVPSVKLDFAQGEIEANPDDQFVVFTWYKAPGRALATRLGDMAVVVDGDVPSRHRSALLRDHEKGRYRVLVGSIATLGESLNLQYMHEAIRLDRAWNPEANGQTVDRLHRHGQQERVTFRDLWATRTVDTLLVMPNLMGKDSLRKAVFG